MSVGREGVPAPGGWEGFKKRAVDTPELLEKIIVW